MISMERDDFFLPWCLPARYWFSLVSCSACLSAELNCRSSIDEYGSGPHSLSRCFPLKRGLHSLFVSPLPTRCV